MSKKTVIILFIYLSLFGLGLYFAYASESLLFDTIPWLIIISIIVGIILGYYRARLKNKPEINNGLVTRHDSRAFFEHWGTVLGILTLIASGILLGFLFLPHLVDTPVAVIFVINVHFLGLVFTLLSGFFFVTDYLLSRNFMLLVPNIKDILHGTLGKYLLRRKWLKETKYLSAQKSSFLVFAFLGAVQLVTGAIKLLAHFWLLSPSVMAITTVIHDIFSLLFIIWLVMHVLFIVVVPKHWPLLRSWFGGKIAEAYIKERHPVWYEELKKDAQPCKYGEE